MNSYIVHIKIERIYKGFLEDVEKRFDTSNDQLKSPLPKGKNQNVIDLMED